MDKRKIKEHWDRNKKTYLAVGGGVVFAGITCTIIERGRYEALATGGAYGLKTADTSVTMRPLSFLSSQKNVKNIVSVVARDGRGHPGYIIRSRNTGEIFSSQREAATVFEISPTLLSKHLSGKLPNVEGYEFERLKFAA